ncbi:gag-pol polyprotein [Cucumis melo var. makuwa]|uniref:Gag-pol polyprotein n=1 Tax=Cucumis melo var. makuwa TaxID=1194695 RepID=A0A5A7TBS9_CUCMM|nr:gag-pol polyprotein [Cucumis melo var. makuwa]TYJ99734.1 gag-pol polyprotein [Cucumis melo var. makuwa]
MVGELTFFLGFQIRQEATSIFFSQKKYAKNLISKFGMDKPKPKRTPIATHLKITKDTTREKVDSSFYRNIIGSLLYLTTSRPDIPFAVGVCDRYQADPCSSHLYSAKRILKYIAGTFNYGIWCTFDTTGVLIGQATSFNKKQNGVSLLTAEAEYIAAGSSCSQLLWMKQMLEEYGIAKSTMALYCDNMSAISISKNPVQHNRTKHIDIHHHFIRELVKDKIICLEHNQSSLQLIDIITKPLDVSTFEGLRAGVGVYQYPA